MSQSGTIITNSSITPQVPTSFVTNSGTAIPAGNVLNVLGAAGTTTTGNLNTITISVTNPFTTWNVIGANQTMVVNNGYICQSGGALVLLLPAVSAVGNEIEITLDGSASFQIIQGAGQQIRLGNLATTAGVGGSITSTQQGDSLRMVCSVANLKWNILSVEGNLTII